MQNTNSLFFHYLLEYNAIFKENDVIYRRMAAQFGLSDSAFWILIVFVKVPRRSPRNSFVNPFT